MKRVRSTLSIFSLASLSVWHMYGKRHFPNDRLVYARNTFSIRSMSQHNTGLQTLRVGRSSASAVRSTRPDIDEHEGVASTSATLYAPEGLDFDKEGNLYITTSNHTIVKVKRWW